MGSEGNVAMGGTRVVSGVASLSGRALLPRGRGWGTVTPGGKAIYEGNASIFITNQTSYLQTDGRQHRQTFATSFAPAPIQEKGTSERNSSSGAHVIKHAGPQIQGQGTRDREDRQQQPGGVFLATSELRPEAVLLPLLKQRVIETSSSWAFLDAIMPREGRNGWGHGD